MAANPLILDVTIPKQIWVRCGCAIPAHRRVRGTNSHTRMANSRQNAKFDAELLLSLRMEFHASLDEAADESDVWPSWP